MADKKYIARQGNAINLSTNKTVGKQYALGDTLKKIGSALDKASPYISGGLGGVSTAMGIYNANSQVGSTQEYDTALSKLDNSISMGNLDALADWRSGIPTYNTGLDASDFDNGMTAGQRFANVASGVASGIASGKGLFGKAFNAVTALGAGLLANRKRKREQERLANEYNEKNLLANERANAMFRHEFNDITEDMKNQALANFSANGGSINIAPSKRGTFKAQATRMGMSVPAAAKHILANKDRYSKEMVKKAAFANAFAHAYGGKLFEDGGPMFNYPTEYTHGGYFSTTPELIEINQGGTHESNPLDGVPMGFDENGVPNLVEEGETIYDDYVFSNRLAPTEEQLIEAGLPTKYKDHTFAYISSKIAEQFKETPNDEISNESLKEYMQRLKTVQEQTKQDKEAEEQVEAANQFASLPPEQQEAVMQQAQDQQEIEAMQQPQEEVVPQEEAMPQGVPSGMEAYGNQPIDMMSYGGNLFAPGGDTSSERPVGPYTYIIKDPVTGRYLIDEDAINHSIEVARSAGRPLDRDQIIKRVQRQIDKIESRERSLSEQEQRKAAARQFIVDKYGEAGLTSKGFGADVTPEDRAEFSRIMQGESGSNSADSVSDEDSVANTRMTTQNAGRSTSTGRASSTRAASTSSTTSTSAATQAAAVKDVNAILTRKDRPLFYEGQAQDAARLAVEKAIPGTDVDITSLESDIASYADSIRNAQETFGRRGYQRRINRGESLDQINAEAEERNERDKLLPTWMRYAPVAGAALSAIWDATQQPDYSVAEAAENVARNVPRARFNPIGDYMSYTPVDRNFYLNQLRNQALATDRSILQASGANQGAATAGLLASQYNTQTGLSNSLMQQELANRQNQQQVAQFNRGTNQYNSQGLFNESVYNQRAGMHRGQYALTAAQLRQAERQRRNAAISADLTNLFQGIGDIGWENFNMNMANVDRYKINKRGGISYEAKRGGMLTKKKSRRK